MAQGDQSTSRAENTDGFVQRGHPTICTAPNSVQSSALSLSQDRLSDEQRSRMHYHKSMALARRKEKLKPQNQDEELLLNRLTPLQSTPSSQQCSPVRSSLAFQQAESSPSLQQNIDQGPVLAHSDSRPPSHRSSHAGFACKQGSLPPTYVQNPSLPWLPQGSHSSFDLDSVCGPLTSQDQIGHSSSSRGSFMLQHDGYLGSSSLTLEQRARMACQREKALAKRKGREKQEHCRDETGRNQCTIVDGPSQKSYQLDTAPSFTPVQISYNAQEEAATGGKMMESQTSSALSFFQHSQDGYRRTASNYVQNSQHGALPLTSGRSIVSSQQSTCNSSSLTPEQRAHMAHQKGMAIARHRAKLLQQQQDDHNPHLTDAQCQDSSQRDTPCGSLLTPGQRARMAHQKELARFRRNLRLQQKQQVEDELNHTQLANAQYLTSSQEDNCGASTLTQEQRTRMATQKEMAIARRNARLLQRQQSADHHVHHKPPNSEQGIELGFLSLATNRLTNCVVDSSQLAINDMEALQEGHISPPRHHQIFSPSNCHDSNLSFAPLRRYETSGSFSTSAESVLSSREDSYDASYLALTQNGGSAFSKEAFLSCSQSCASSLSMDGAAVCSQGSWEYFSAEDCDGLASDYCCIASQESQHFPENR